MEASEIAKSIKNCIIRKAPVNALLVAGKDTIMHHKTMGFKDISKDAGLCALRSVFNCTSNSTFKYLLYNPIKDDVNFKRKIGISFIASNISSIVTKLIFHPDADFGSFAYQPIIDGIFSVFDFISSNWDESDPFLREQFPTYYPPIGECINECIEKFKQQMSIFN